MVTKRGFLVGGLCALGAGAAAKLSSGGPGARAATAGAFEVVKSEQEWRRILTPEEYHILREHGTEPAWSSPLDKENRAGTFHCAGCGQALYASETKFDSGTGWPSFYAPIEGAIGTSEDRSWFAVRTEVHCSRCGGHQGHVFEDGPPPTGLRYCMNGLAMDFKPAGAAGPSA